MKNLGCPNTPVSVTGSLLCKGRVLRRKGVILFLLTPVPPPTQKTWSSQGCHQHFGCWGCCKCSVWGWLQIAAEPGEEQGQAPSLNLLGKYRYSCSGRKTCQGEKSPIQAIKPHCWSSRSAKPTMHCRAVAMQAGLGSQLQPLLPGSGRSSP